VYDFLQKEANKQLEVSLDNNSYDESELILLKVPVHLPYQTSWSAYERYNGEITLKGVKYKYVKRKLANDTLYLKCIPNTKEMELQTAKNDFFQLSNNLLQNSNSKKADNAVSVFKNLQPVFDGSSLGFTIHSPLEYAKRNWVPLKPEHFLSIILLSPEQPPDAVNAWYFAICKFYPDSPVNTILPALTKLYRF